MIYNATITSFNFYPMSDNVPSYLSLCVKIPAFEMDVQLKDEYGSIDELSKKFEFSVDKDVYNFGDFIGRRCKVEKINEDFVLKNLI